ncbi:MAG: hypothetical protein IPK01_13625 [Acidobacteria bacterium]|nr:hypothetical protein [Acidobacteriota bacterium]
MLAAGERICSQRQRLAIAEGRLVQAGLRPNPVFSTEYGSPVFWAAKASMTFPQG